MKKSSTQIATLIILLSIVTVIIPFATYYFLDAALPAFGVAVLIILLFSHLFLEHSLNYESCFSFTLLNVLISSIIVFLSYFGKSASFLPYKTELLFFIGLNWFLPFVYCIVRNLLDRGSKYVGFNIFFRNSSMVFIVFYISALILILFIQNADSVLYYTNFETINLIPFLTLATLIEDLLINSNTFPSIATYLLRGMVIFIPFGFYAILLLRHRSRSLRFLVLVAFPLLIEVIQRIFLLGKGDIDDILIGLLGGLIGGLLYHLLNSIYRQVADEDFLYERSHYSFYGNSLHF